jgi:hypothetical protein
MRRHTVPSFHGIHPAVREYARTRGAEVVLDNLATFFKAMSPALGGYKNPLYKPIMIRMGVTYVNDTYEFDAVRVHCMAQSFVVASSEDLQTWLCSAKPPLPEADVLFVELLAGEAGVPPAAW